MNNELAKIQKSLRLIKAYALFMTLLFTVMTFSGFTQSGAKQNFEELTAKRICMLDSTGKTRVILSGEFPKPPDL